MKTNSIKCDKCGSLFDEDSNSYLVFSCNVTVGKQGGIIGNNFGLERKSKND